jgi:hypothetical protein
MKPAAGSLSARRTRNRAEYLDSLARTHGIRATYVNGCRCPECRQAERDYRRAYRARKRQTR